LRRYISDFGAFVEIKETDKKAPRLEGLIHISELSWNRVSHPRDVVGQCRLTPNPKA
jgi:ribosomal protein S1